MLYSQAEIYSGPHLRIHRPARWLICASDCAPPSTVTTHRHSTAPADTGVPERGLGS